MKTMAAGKAALARARAAREKLDEDRRTQEQRQDVATATALVALEQLAEADAARELVLAGVGQAVRELIQQDVSAERAAGLLGVEIGEVRRFLKVASVEDVQVSGSATAAGSSKAASRSSNGAAGDGPVSKVTPPPAEQSGGAIVARRAG